MTTALARKIAKDTFEGPRVERKIASGQSIKPGHLVRVTSAGELTVQATAGSDAPALLVLEDKYQGDHTAGGGVDKVYTAGSPAEAEYVQPGFLRYVRVPNGTVLEFGDDLVYNNAGQLIKTTGSPLRVVATSEEALTASGEQLVLVRFA
jgi:hypothetical protein